MGSIDIEAINDNYQSVMALRLGTDRDPSIRDLANTSTWRGKIVQIIRILTGNKISKENNTSLVNRAYGEGEFREKVDPLQDFRAEQLKQISEKMETIAKNVVSLDPSTDNTWLKSALQQHHLENPEVGLKNLKDLEKKMGHLATASKMLCGECQSPDSVNTKGFVDEMSARSDQFEEVQKIIHDVRTQLEENEKVIAMLREASPEYVFSATNSTLSKEFIRVYLGRKRNQTGRVTSEEAPKFQELFKCINTPEALDKETLEKVKDEMNTKYKEFVLQYTKDVLSDREILKQLKQKLNEPAYRAPALKQVLNDF